MAGSDQAAGDDEGTLLGQLTPSNEPPRVNDVSAAAIDPAESQSLPPGSTLPEEGPLPSKAVSAGGSMPPVAPAPFSHDLTTQSFGHSEASSEIELQTAIDEPPPLKIEPMPRIEPSRVRAAGTPPALALRPHRGTQASGLASLSVHARPVVRSILDFGQHRLRPSLLGAKKVVSQSGLSLVHRFERLPRRYQIAWVALPYAAAFALVVSLYLSRTQPVEVASRPSTVPPVTTTPAPAPSAPSMPVEQPAAPAALQTRVVTLTRPSALYIRPDATVIRSARLPEGHVVTVYVDFPCPEGWALGQSEKGTVGYISTLHLDGQPDPFVDAVQQNRRRRK